MVANTPPSRSASFTMSRLEKVPPPPSGLTWVGDPKMPGLFLVVSPTGRRWWYFYKKVGGKPCKIKLADFEALTIEEARGRSAEKLAEMSRDLDPGIEHRRERARLRNESTVGELFSVYLEEQAKPFKRSWEEDERRYNTHLKKWAPRRLSDILRQDVLALHRKIGADHPFEANRVLMLVSRLFSFAEENVESWDRANPARKIKKFNEPSRTRYLSPSELSPLLRVVEAEENEIVRDVIGLALHTQQRKSNVLRMKWPSLNLNSGEWTIRAGEFKGKKEHVVPLTDAAIEILRRRFNSRDRHPEWVFPGRAKIVDGERQVGPLKDIKAQWTAIREAAGLVDFRFHDLRRTAATRAIDSGVSIYDVQKTLGHRDIKTTEVYARRSVAKLRETLNAASQSLLDAAKPEIVATVTAKPAKSRKSKSKPTEN